MSALRAPAGVPARRTAPTARRASLTAVDPRPSRRLDAVRAPLQSTSGTPFLVLCAMVLVGALLAALALNTTMARGSYEMSGLQRDVGRVAQDVQHVQADLRAAEASLARRAEQLGMVPVEDMTMFSAVSGEVLGLEPAEGS